MLVSFEVELLTVVGCCCSFETWMSFWVEFCHGASAKWNAERSEAIFTLLDADGDGHLSLQDRAGGGVVCNNSNPVFDIPE